MVTAGDVCKAALRIVGRTKVSNTADFDRVFVSCFGMCAFLCVQVWEEISQKLPKNAEIVHLLWGLAHLKVYGTEDTMASWLCTTRKTYRRWVKLIVVQLYEMSYVSVD